MSDLTLTHTVLRGDARLIKVPNARFLDSTLTLRLHGACAVTLRVPPHLKAGLGNGVQMLPISLSAEGWEVTLHHRDGDLSVFQNLEALLRLGKDSTVDLDRTEAATAGKAFTLRP